MCEIDNGFEDREGHQAPFTLRIADCGLRIAGRSTIARAECATKKLLLEFFDCAHDLVEVRPLAGVEFGMEKFAIGANLESAAARRNEGKRLDALAKFKNLGRQTDGLRRVVSNDAVFDRHFGFHHELLSDLNRIYAKKDGQELEALDNGAISLGRRSALGMTNRR